MTPKVGQRWLWELNGYVKTSKTVLEITRIDPNHVYFIYVQIIEKGYPQDILGRTGFTGFTSVNYFTSEDVTYLVGQDKAANE